MYTTDVSPTIGDDRNDSSMPKRFSDVTVESIAKNQDDAYTVRVNCVQSWFLASSVRNKERFLAVLLDAMNPGSLPIVLKALDCRRDKTHVYTTAHQTTNFIYDKHLSDHNRALQHAHLEEAMRTDLDWYGALDESKQLCVIFDLLKLSGGAATSNTFYTVLAIYRRKQNEADGVAKSQAAASEACKKLMQSCAIKAEKARSVWADAINKYRAEVEGKPDSSGTEKTTRTKSSKSSAKSKKDTSGDTTVDRVQLLPVWICKRIFNFLDQKTLQRAREVNAYWAYVVDDARREQAARKRLQKTIDEIRAQIEADADEIQMKEAPRSSPLETRLEKLARRGAVHPKLRPMDQTTDVVQKSLVTDAVSKKTDEYIVPVAKLRTFARNVPIDDATHRFPSCVLDEVFKANAESQTSPPSLSREFQVDWWTRRGSRSGSVN